MIPAAKLGQLLVLDVSSSNYLSGYAPYERVNHILKPHNQGPTNAFAVLRTPKVRTLTGRG